MTVDYLTEHLSGQPEFGLSQSPAGKDCVFMKIDGKRWILLTSMLEKDAFEQGIYMHEQDIETRFDRPFDWKQSIASKELVSFTEDEMKNGKIVGVYIPEDKFDKFVDLSMRASTTI